MTAVADRPETRKVLKAPALKPGDSVGLVCPASRPATPAEVERAKRVVEEMRLKPVIGKNVLKVHGFTAGTVDQRLADLNGFLKDDSIAGIFCITGGYGSLHLLPRIDFGSIAQNPKVIVGCDDNTAMLNAITGMTGLVTFHGPNLDQVKTKFTFSALQEALMNNRGGLSIAASDISDDEIAGGVVYAPVEGTAEGHVVGGNLTAFVSLLGTPFEPYTAGSLLMLEDRNEQFGILDRWFSTLYVAGHLELANGVGFGYFEKCDSRNSYNMLSYVDTFGDRLKKLNKPSCFGLPVGQGRQTKTMPLGLNARFEAQQGRLEYSEAALS